jgi:hypothetical protein
MSAKNWLESQPESKKRREEEEEEERKRVEKERKAQLKQNRKIQESLKQDKLTEILTEIENIPIEQQEQLEIIMAQIKVETLKLAVEKANLETQMQKLENAELIMESKKIVSDKINRLLQHEKLAEYIGHEIMFERDFSVTVFWEKGKLRFSVEPFKKPSAYHIGD